MGELHDLGVICKTDKAIRHEYLDIYEKHISGFRHKPISFLEIGYKDGHSAIMWEAYFDNEKNKFYSMDLCPKLPFPSKKTTIFKLDQSNRDHLRLLKTFKPFDIIIDDGGHTVEQQQVSFGILFQYVRPGGIYIIEDLFLANTEPEVYNSTSTEKTTEYMLKKIRDSGTVDGAFILEKEAIYIEQNVSQCIIEKGKKSEIGFIFKKNK